jgi:hypothetical protein
MIRKRLPALAVISGALLAATTATAAQASTPFCGSGGSGRCQSDHGNTGNGSPLFTENRVVGPNQDLALTVNHGACNNGNVTNTCPLDNHAIDAELAIDGAIIEKEDLDTGPCVDVSTTGSGNVIVNACNAGGSDWIVFTNGSLGRQLISVWATNHLSPNDPLYLDNAATTGDQLLLAGNALVSPTNWGH